MLRVSFYSYKGGAGRSTTSWNTIERLYHIIKPTPENPFIIMDTDIESAGSTFLYNAVQPFYRNRTFQSLQSRIKGNATTDGVSADDRKMKFYTGMHPVGESFGLSTEMRRSILLVGVDLDRNTDIIDKTGSNKEQFDNFRELVNQCNDFGASAVFFDTPSGTQGLARMSREESDVVVCCMRPTNQFREGTKLALEEFVKQDEDSLVTYILTPTAVCVDHGQMFDRKEYPARARELIELEFDRNEFKGQVKLDLLKPTPSECKIFKTQDDDDRVFGIPEVKRFKWFESCLNCMGEDELTSNDQMGINRYEYLAQTIMKYN